MELIFFLAADTNKSVKEKLCTHVNKEAASTVILATKNIEMLLKTPICPLVFVRMQTTWKSLVLYCTCVRVCLHVQYSQTVEVESARRGNLLYMQRADVSCVYPCSHRTKEPCIQSHSYPRPSLSWFSDISNVLFPFFPRFSFLLFIFFFHLYPAQLRTDRSTLWNRF